MDKQKTPQRLQSLDALRGFDMFFIMGGATLIAAIATFWPNYFTQWLATQMGQEVCWWISVGAEVRRFLSVFQPSLGKRQ